MTIFSCENKPTDATEAEACLQAQPESQAEVLAKVQVKVQAEVQADAKKAKELPEKRLIYIQSLLPHPSNIKYIEVISSQFYGLKLIVYGSKMTEKGNIIHYQKKTKAAIPTSLPHMLQAAHFLLTIMSLQVSPVVTFIIDFDIYCFYLPLLIESYHR